MATNITLEPEAFDNYAITKEEGICLYGLVAAIRPRRTLELNAGKGVSTWFIASALRNLGLGGTLTSYEPISEFADIADKRLAEYDIKVNRGPILFDTDYDMVFLDSHWPDRRVHIDYWKDKPVFLIIHDAKEGVPCELRLPEGGTILPTQRGIWVRNHLGR